MSQLLARQVVAPANGGGGHYIRRVALSDEAVADPLTAPPSHFHYRPHRSSVRSLMPAWVVAFAADAVVRSAQLTLIGGARRMAIAVARVSC